MKRNEPVGKTGVAHRVERSLTAPGGSFSMAKVLAYLDSCDGWCWFEGGCERWLPITL